MKKTLTTIAFLGTFGLSVLGCSDYDVSKISKDIKLEKPADCKNVEDIRYEIGYGMREYQLLCRDNNNKLALYTRPPNHSSWTKITIKK